MSRLNELLSKIISKLNTSVKTEAQNLTEQEKIQVRENIGAGAPQVQADLSQNDETAIDYVKNRLAWEEEKIIFPESIIDVPDDGEAYFTNDSFKIEDGKYYLVKCNNIKYYCSTFKIIGRSQGNLIVDFCLGNKALGFDEESIEDNTGEPFFIQETYGNDEFVFSRFCGEPGQHTLEIVEIITHKIEPQFYEYLLEGEQTEKDIIPRMKIVFDEENLMYPIVPSIIPDMADGTIVAVTINEEVYITKVNTFTFQDKTSIKFLGNFGVVNPEVPITKEPFIIVINDDTGNQDENGAPIYGDIICIFDISGSNPGPLFGTSTISAKIIETPKIQEKYLPVIDYNSDFIKDKPFYREKQEIIIPLNAEDYVIPGIITKDSFAHIIFDGKQYEISARFLSWPTIADTKFLEKSGLVLFGNGMLSGLGDFMEDFYMDVPFYQHQLMKDLKIK